MALGDPQVEGNEGATMPGEHPCCWGNGSRRGLHLRNAPAMEPPGQVRDRILENISLSIKKFQSYFVVCKDETPAIGNHIKVLQQLYEHLDHALLYGLQDLPSSSLAFQTVWAGEAPSELRGFQPPWISPAFALRVQMLLQQVGTTMALQGVANCHMFLVAFKLLEKRRKEEEHKQKKREVDHS